MILFKDTKAMVHFLDNDTDFVDIIAGVLSLNTLSSFLFIICLDYML